MIVYQQNKAQFLEDILSNDIENIILNAFQSKDIRSSTSQSELNAWKHSMQHMHSVLCDPQIPEDCGIAIEYHLPQTSKRVDIILTGRDESQVDHLILIELKQWSKAERTDKDAIVRTYVGKAERELPHPSYQAWSYAALLEGFNQTVSEENIQLKPCAYLHNYGSDQVIDHAFYSDYIQKAPLFLKSDARKLREFIKRYIKHGDCKNVLYRIDQGKIKPSKGLVDNITAMLKGNEAFIMIDDQKMVYEKARALATRSSNEHKHVLIVEGGPGTGKSVVAVNLLVNLLKQGLLTHYISKNAAPRAVYASKLTGSFKKNHINFLFRGSGIFTESESNEFDALIVDEAHRLNEKSGLYSNLGENQIKEIIRASRFSVFFLDEDQKVTLNDIGDKEQITKWAYHQGATVHRMELTSQFRCNGSDGYLAWLDDVLDIRETANQSLAGLNYDFQVMSSPQELRSAILEKNKLANRARMVAGYCWKWESKNDPRAMDVVIPEYNFTMQWNLTKDGSLWLISPESVSEIGCIHTCQGLEVDYIGVIVGPDFIVRNGKVKTDPSKRASSDASLKTHKSYMQKHPITGLSTVDRIIKNTYRTLMTRGMKGCYVYFTDKETEAFFKSRM